jgi:hypothetical protein
VTSPPDKPAPGSETAAAIFDRIKRRREESVQPAAGSILRVPKGQAGLSDYADHPDRSGQVGVSDPLPHVSVADGLFEAPPVAPRAAADRFPRSATMRLVLKHPALALGLGVPAAGLLLKSPASRRLLGMALRAGVGGEIQSLVRLTRAADLPAAQDRPATDPNPLNE